MKSTKIFAIAFAITLSITTTSCRSRQPQGNLGPGDMRELINAMNEQAGATLMFCVKTHGGAVGDGITDDTDAIQTLINSTPAQSFIFFPPGVFLISNTIHLKYNDSPFNHDGFLSQWGANHILGAGEHLTTIKLADNAPGFNNPDAGKPMMTLGRWGSADSFFNTIHHMTFDATAAGNAGAIGIQYFSNNAGNIRHVTIKADTGGHIGLDVGYNDMNGPALIQHVTIYGFNTGISYAHTVNSMTFEHIHLVGQRTVGIINNGQVATFRRLTSVNTVMAIDNNGGNLTLIDSELRGATGGTAVRNRGGGGIMFLRNVTAEGYDRLLENSAPSPNNNAATEGLFIDEWFSSRAARLFDDSPLRTLHLEIKDTPLVPFDPDFSNWANIREFGAVGNSTVCDTDAIQAALNSGATTVFIPRSPTGGSYRMTETVTVPPTVERIIGLGGHVMGVVPNRDTPIFLVEQDADRPVVFENFRQMFGSSSLFPIKNSSARTMIVLGSQDGGVKVTGTGYTFINDMCAYLRVGRGARVWGRQINTESRHWDNVVNDGGSLVIIGYKTEFNRRLVVTINGGETEILGGLNYNILNPADTGHPAAYSVLQGTSGTPSRFSIAGVKEVDFANRNLWQNLVIEERNGEYRTLRRNDEPGLPLGPNWGTSFMLFAGYPEDTTSRAVVKTFLGYVIADAKTRVKADYLPATGVPFALALADAETVYANSGATQKQVNTARVNLVAAMANLRENPTTTDVTVMTATGQIIRHGNNGHIVIGPYGQDGADVFNDTSTGAVFKYTVDFGNGGHRNFEINYGRGTSFTNDGSQFLDIAPFIEIRLGTQDGTVLARHNMQLTPDWTDFKTFDEVLLQATPAGVHEIYFLIQSPDARNIWTGLQHFFKFLNSPQ